MNRTFTLSKKKRENPEEIAQKCVVDFLEIALPTDVLFWAVPNGGLSHGQNGRNKAMGARAGVLVLHFLLPTGILHMIEMKAPARNGKPAGRLSREQKDFINALPSAAKWAVCHSVDEVELTLRDWGMRLNATVFPKAVVKTGRAA